MVSVFPSLLVVAINWIVKIKGELDMDKESFFSTSGAVAKRLQISRAQLLYLIEKGDLPEPSSQVPGRRLFTEENIKEIEFFLRKQLSLSNKMLGQQSPIKGDQKG